MDLIEGTGRILVMDDEKIVLEICVDLLDDLGYSVTGVTDGAKMLDKYRKAQERDKPYDLVIIDLTIRGGMGGLEAMEKLLKFDPKVRAIVCSGYSNDPVMANFEEYGFKANCTKPFQFATLSKIVDQVITCQPPI